MNPCELTAAITALGNTIACKIPDENELILIATAIIQLGYTLETIALQREACKAVCEHTGSAISAG